MLGLTPKTQNPEVREWVRLKVCIHNAAKDRRKPTPGTDAGT